MAALLLKVAKVTKVAKVVGTGTNLLPLDEGVVTFVTFAPIQRQ